jgi:hypothetical protein
VYDALGKLLIQQSVPKNNGASAIPLDVSSLSKGVYLLEVHDTSSRKAHKTIIIE